MLEFRVLNGPQSGATINLNNEKFKVGNNLDCDIVIYNQDIEDFSFDIEIVKDKITIFPIQKNIGFSSADSMNSPFTLDIGQCFCVGNAWFGIYNKGDAWPESGSWLNKPNKANKEIDDLLAFNNDENMPDVESNNKNNIVKSQNTSVNNKNNKSNFVFIIPVVIFLLLIGVVATIYYLDQDNNDQNSKQKSKANTKKTDNKTDNNTDLENTTFLINSLGLTNYVTVKLNKDNKIILSGYVKTDDDLNRLNENIQISKLKIKNEVFSDEEIYSKLTDQSSNLDEKILINQVEKGEVSVGTKNIAGMDEQKKKEIDLYLKSAHRGVSSVIFDEKGKLQDNLRIMFNQMNIGKKLLIKSNDTGISISGKLSTAELEVFEKVLVEANSKYGNDTAINAKISTTNNNRKENNRKLPFDVTQIILTPIPYVVIGNQKIFIGDIYQDYRLDNITEHKIIFDGKSRIELNW